MPASISASAPSPVTPSQARTALIVLTGINLLNYLDRYIVPGMLKALRESELQLDYVQAGWLATSFLLVYAITSPFFGRRGDRGSRRHPIALGIAIWSVASALGGFAGSFIGLLIARSLVGVGEAAYGTIAPAMLADYFP